MPSPSQQRGQAVLLLMIALGIFVVGFGLGQLNDATRKTRQSTDTRKAMAQAIEAVMGYAASRPGVPFLPCPDKTTAAGAGAANDGQEDRIPVLGTCVSLEGNFPWVTLGVPALDGWGDRLRYRVAATFSGSATGFTLGSVGDITVRNAAGAITANTVPVMLISHGPNRWGATTSAGVVTAIPPVANTTERLNTDANTIFVSDISTTAAAPGGEFDDLALWLATVTLTARMQQAGKL
jgi:hypothetical protein